MRRKAILSFVLCCILLLFPGNAFASIEKTTMPSGATPGPFDSYNGEIKKIHIGTYYFKSEDTGWIYFIIPKESGTHTFYLRLINDTGSTFFSIQDVYGEYLYKKDIYNNKLLLNIDLEADKYYELNIGKMFQHDACDFAICSPSCHAYISGEKEIVEAPTCTEAGRKANLCKACLKEFNVEAIPPRGHTLGDWETVEMPTCTQPGLETRFCKVCRETLGQNEIPATGHTISAYTTIREADCTHMGIGGRYCLVCNEILETNDMPALGHDYTEWIITKEATKQEEGEQYRCCIRCGDTLYEIIPKKPKFLGIF